MKKKRFSVEQIVAVLKRRGLPDMNLIRQLGVSAADVLPLEEAYAGAGVGSGPRCFPTIMTQAAGCLLTNMTQGVVRLF